MNSEILLVNSIILTLFVIILDHVFIRGHISPFESMGYQYFNDEEIDNLREQILKEEKQKKKENKKQKKLEKVLKKEQEERGEDTLLLQNYHEQIATEAKFINNNHPNNLSDQCRSHSEFVHMNTNTNTNLNNYDNNNNDLYPDYMAYNE